MYLKWYINSILKEIYPKALYRARQNPMNKKATQDAVLLIWAIEMGLRQWETTVTAPDQTFIAKVRDRIKKDYASLPYARDFPDPSVF